MEVGRDEEISSCPSNGGQVVVRTMEDILDTTPVITDSLLTQTVQFCLSSSLLG